MLLCLNAKLICDACKEEIFEKHLSFLANDTMELPISYALERGATVREDSYFYCKSCTEKYSNT